MEIIEHILGLHIVAGAVGLIVFWVPVFARKGGVNHVRFGKVFKWSAYLSMGFAALVVIERTSVLWLAGERPWTAPNSFSFSVFLGYLALITFFSVHHGIGVLSSKNDPLSLRTPLRIFVALSSMAASFVVIIFALTFKPDAMIILLVLSPIGFLGGFGSLRYLNNIVISRHAWLYEHLGSMLGAGIAFHTAFAVFGMNGLFDLKLSGPLRILPWIAPTLIGIPAITLWQHTYKKNFGALKTAAP